jgi:hypothetical protein
MRHLLVLAVVLALLGALYFFVQGGATSVHGRVLLQDVEGGEQPGGGARIAWQPSAVVEQHLHAWLEVREKWQRENELEIRAARNEWSQKVSARDEAARILRVAERANSADLEICRARYREAAADAEDALRDLEAISAGADEAADPARFLAGLPAPSIEFVADADGRFSARVPHGEAGYFVASLEQAGDQRESLVWLRRVEPDANGAIQLSNANLATGETLARLARETKSPEAPDAIPAEPPAK